MSYSKQNFVDGIVLSAAHLNHMEEGIAEAHEGGGASSWNDLTDKPDVVLYSEQTLTEEQKAQARANIGLAVVEPAEDDIPKVFFGANLPQTKDDAIMSFRYISKTEDIKCYCKIKAQGNSSMSYPKKNQTVKLYKDAECTEKLKVDFKGWGKQNKFCFKANWIDLTHARNIVSARLWGDVVKSRSNYAEIPELLRTSPNQGAVDGFPVKVYANGIYQGRYTLNIPKDAWMANMDDELDEHCILCGENYVSGCFRAEAKIDESDWTDEIHETVPASIKNRWNEAIRFVMNSTDEEFVADIGNYFDLGSLIDYYLFGVASCNLDGFGKNQLYMTYDSLKWYATVYDLDATWGLWWNGSKFVSADYNRSVFQDFMDGDGNLLYIRLESLFIDEIKMRWEELRSGALSIANIVNHFERFTDICPPYLVEEDYADTTAGSAFAQIPSRETNNVQQLRGYATERMTHADSYIEALGVDPTLLYSLPNETVFDGTSSDQIIYTDIQLFNETKSFTIIIDASYDSTAQKGLTVFDNTRNSNNSYVGGARLATYNWGNGFAVFGYSGNGGAEIFPQTNSTERAKIAVVYTDGLPTAQHHKLQGGTNIITKSPNPSYVAAVQHDGYMAIGGQTIGDSLFVGTIHSLEIYSCAMTTEEITAKLTE